MPRLLCFLLVFASVTPVFAQQEMVPTGEDWVNRSGEWPVANFEFDDGEWYTLVMRVNGTMYWSDVRGSCRDELNTWRDCARGCREKDSRRWTDMIRGVAWAGAICGMNTVRKRLPPQPGAADWAYCFAAGGAYKLYTDYFNAERDRNECEESCGYAPMCVGR